jgi:hypothetical protein
MKNKKVQFLIKVPPQLLAALKTRAAAEKRRSAQELAQAILERYVEGTLK